MVSIPKQEREALGRAWLERTLAAYPEQTRRFLVRESDPFRNPIGHALREKVPILADELLGTMNIDRLNEALGDLVRIRAVQDFKPSDAVAFLFELRSIVHSRGAGGIENWDELDRRIEQAALLAFDLYMACREKIYDIQVDEARRRTAHLERIFLEDESR